MRVKYLNPISAAVSSVFQGIGVGIEKQETHLLHELPFEKPFVFEFRFSGDLKGVFSVGMDTDFVVSLASNMTGGMTGDEVDELVVSCLSEICNMMKGKMTELLENEGYRIQIQQQVLQEGVQYETETGLHLLCSTDMDTVDVIASVYQNK